MGRLGKGVPVAGSVSVGGEGPKLVILAFVENRKI